MSKPSIRSLKKMDFLKVVPNREHKISEAPAKPLPPTDSYKANELATALHPKCQYLRVAEILEPTKDTKSFILVPDKEMGTKTLAYFSAGQYLTITLTVGSAVITRPYSLSSSPREALEGKYMLTIKRVDDGLASQYILDKWSVGTKVTASEPLGVFTYEPLRDARHIIGIAGGSGITPFRSLAKAIADGDEDAELTLIYGSKTKADALFQDEFEKIAASCNRFSLVNVLSDESEEACERGFITADIIKNYVPKDADYSLFICGPQAMYDFVDKEIALLGLRRKFIRHELFGEYRNPSGDSDYPRGIGDKFELTVIICGEEQKLKCSANDSLLVTMERGGIAVPAHCRSGICGWCHSRLLSGDVYVPKSVDGRRMADLDFGYIHPCCTFPLSDIILEVPPFQA
ncbi:MAG: iron-sulfur cluster-binding domain-containing protein [Oscillospiraceae bacterium]|nr:iron-sulfur cluster-binding domain-containing protein [Oscillospiraceae bacterium]